MFRRQLAGLPVVDIHIVAAHVAVTVGNPLGNALGNEPLRIEVHPLDGGMDEWRACLELAAAHLHGQYRVLSIGIEAEGWDVHEYVFVMLLG